MEKAPEAFRTISEVADELEVPKHVLRFWEAKFAQLKPMKRGGGRRYYRPEDVALLRGIRFLLYNDGYTIRGVQKILREHGPRYVMDYRGLAEDIDDDDLPAGPEIPDVAAEAAKSGGTYGRPASQAIARRSTGTRSALYSRKSRPARSSLPPPTPRTSRIAMCALACFVSPFEYMQSACIEIETSERSAARLAHRSGGPGVGSSNLPAPTILPPWTRLSGL